MHVGQEAQEAGLAAGSSSPMNSAEAVRVPLVAVTSNQATNSRDGGESEEEDECRICRDGSSVAPLLHLCGCRGSMAWVHHRCATQWLQYSHGSSMRTVPLCGVCQQPFAIKIPGFWTYLRCRLTSPKTFWDVYHAAGSFAHHLHSEPSCGHMHCLALRWLLALAALQLALWQGQVFMLLSFFPIRAALHVDQKIDSIVVPPVLLPLLHIAFPPVREVGHFTLGFQSSDGAHGSEAAATGCAGAASSACGTASTCSAASACVSACVPASCARACCALGAIASMRATVASVAATVRRRVATRVRAVWRTVFPSRAAPKSKRKRAGGGAAMALSLRALAAAAAVAIIAAIRSANDALSSLELLPLWRVDADALCLGLATLQLDCLLLGALVNGRRRAESCWLLTRLAPLLQPALPNDAGELLSAAIGLPPYAYLGRLLLALCGLLPLGRAPIRLLSPTANALALHMLLALTTAGALEAVQVLIYGLVADFERWRWAEPK
mmetsp:Transcript_58525/g.127098  ORF Transcript_58525/g.127098 Transcript_58525/m.127098 type:complete len:497 (+) Transcript_58525:52-1542(+)